VDAAGTTAALAAVKTYSMTGTLELRSKGVLQSFDHRVYREYPGKYSEISSSPATGEIRSIHDGTMMHITTDYGLDRKLPVPPMIKPDLEYLAPVRRVREVATFPKLAYLGTFERNGRKVHVIEAASTEATVALSFDVESKMLASLASDWVTIAYSDFRKVGELTLPFRVEHGSAMTISLNDIKLNTAIDPSVFQPQDRCFDKP
jgi:hypothetical protein